MGFRWGRSGVGELLDLLILVVFYIVKTVTGNSGIPGCSVAKTNSNARNALLIGICICGGGMTSRSFGLTTIRNIIFEKYANGRDKTHRPTVTTTATRTSGTTFYSTFFAASNSYRGCTDIVTNSCSHIGATGKLGVKTVIRISGTSLHGTLRGTNMIHSLSDNF